MNGIKTYRVPTTAVVQAHTAEEATVAVIDAINQGSVSWLTPRFVGGEVTGEPVLVSDPVTFKGEVLTEVEAAAIEACLASIRSTVSA